MCRRWPSCAAAAARLFFLDAIQGLGVFPLDVHAAGVDFLAADGHKWMLGPEGAGLLFVKHEHLNLLRPLGVRLEQRRGRQRLHADRAQPASDAASRYEGGLAEHGRHDRPGREPRSARRPGPVAHDLSPLADQVLAITDYACERLRALGATLLAPRDRPAPLGHRHVSACRPRSARHPPPPGSGRHHRPLPGGRRADQPARL